MKLVRVSVDFAVCDELETTPAPFTRDLREALETVDGEVLRLTIEDWQDHPFPDPVIRNQRCDDPELQRADERAIEAWVAEARRARAEA